jgi:hypothetical protein
MFSTGESECQARGGENLSRRRKKYSARVARGAPTPPDRTYRILWSRREKIPDIDDWQP